MKHVMDAIVRSIDIRFLRMQLSSKKKRILVHTFKRVSVSIFANNIVFLLLQLDLVLKDEDGGDLSDFITNGEWSLLSK